MVHKRERRLLMPNVTTEEQTTSVCTVENRDTLPPIATQTPTRDEAIHHSEVRLQILVVSGRLPTGTTTKAVPLAIRTLQDDLAIPHQLNQLITLQLPPAGRYIV